MISQKQLKEIYGLSAEELKKWLIDNNYCFRDVFKARLHERSLVEYGKGGFCSCCGGSKNEHTKECMWYGNDTI